jgi:hypothetical protein
VTGAEFIDDDFFQVSKSFGAQGRGQVLGHRDTLANARRMYNLDAGPIRRYESDVAI